MQKNSAYLMLLFFYAVTRWPSGEPLPVKNLIPDQWQSIVLARSIDEGASFENPFYTMPFIEDRFLFQIHPFLAGAISQERSTYLPVGRWLNFLSAGFSMLCVLYALLRRHEPLIAFYVMLFWLFSPFRIACDTAMPGLEPLVTMAVCAFWALTERFVPNPDDRLYFVLYIPLHYGYWGRDAEVRYPAWQGFDALLEHTAFLGFQFLPPFALLLFLGLLKQDRKWLVSAIGAVGGLVYSWGLPPWSTTAYLLRVAAFLAALHLMALALEGAYLWAREQEEVTRGRIKPSAVLRAVVILMCLGGLSMARPETAFATPYQCEATRWLQDWREEGRMLARKVGDAGSMIAENVTYLNTVEFMCAEPALLFESRLQGWYFRPAELTPEQLLDFFGENGVLIAVPFGYPTGLASDLTLPEKTSSLLGARCNLLYQGKTMLIFGEVRGADWARRAFLGKPALQ